MTAALLLLVLAVSGGPLAALVSGRRAEALLLAPLLGAAFLSLAATVEVAVGGPQLGLALAALVLGALGPLLLLAKRSVGLRWPGWHRDLLLLAGPLIVLGWTLTTLQRVHVSYDGRSIWFLHARMLLGGHDVYLEQAAALPFGHADYPPLVPATIALGWKFAGSIDYRTGQLVVAALTACATVLACLGAARAVRASGLQGGLLAGVGVLVLYGVWDEYATNGYVDPLTASLVAGGLVHGLLVRRSDRSAGLVLSQFLLASLTKNEGLTFALISMLAVAVLEWREDAARLRARWSAFALVAGLMLLWPFVVHVRGITSDLSTRPKLPGRAGDPLLRVQAVVERLLHMLPTAALGFAALSALGVVVGPDHRRRIRLYLLTHAACLAALLAVYAFGPLEIHFWIATSLQRTSMTLRAGGLLGALCAGAAALERLAARRDAAVPLLRGRWREPAEADA